MTTNEQNLILQSYINVALFFSLGENKFIESDYFNDMNMPSWLKDQLTDINVDNRATVLMSLYGMLVVPKELIQNEFPNEFEDVEEFLKEHLHVIENSYTKSKKLVNHLRNSIAHARVEFIEQESIKFFDESGDQKFEALMELKDIEPFIIKLQSITFKYVENSGGKVV